MLNTNISWKDCFSKGAKLGIIYTVASVVLLIATFASIYVYDIISNALAHKTYNLDKENE